MVCLSGIKTAELLNCTETVEKNGSALYKISEPAEPNWEADWAIGVRTNLTHFLLIKELLMILNIRNNLLFTTILFTFQMCPTFKRLNQSPAV